MTSPLSFRDVKRKRIERAIDEFEAENKRERRPHPIDGAREHMGQWADNVRKRRKSAVSDPEQETGNERG